MAQPTLSRFLGGHLTIKDVLHEDEEQSPPAWQPGTTVRIKEETYCQYLDLLPPRYLDGSLFAFGEGSGAWSIFWREGGSFYVHHLTPEDTDTFRELAGLGRHR